MTTVSQPTERNLSGVTIRHFETRSNFERYAWLFMRLSGVALLLLAVGHMVLQHLLNDVHNLSLLFVAEQWDSWGWKAYDMLLLFFALSHGVNGLRTVLEEYIHSRSAMRAITIILVVFLVASVAWSGYAIAVFDAEGARQMGSVR